jgi:hypothetical protein
MATALSEADSDFIMDQTRALHRKVLGKRVSPSPLFVIIDEAQIAAATFREAFLSGDYKTHRPVLREIIVTWNSMVKEIMRNLIICGTGLSMDMLEDALASNALKYGKGIRKFSNLGGFDTQEAQEKYILQNLWTGVKSREESSSDFQVLLDRAWRWLKGRSVERLS